VNLIPYFRAEPRSRRPRNLPGPKQPRCAKATPIALAAAQKYRQGKSVTPRRKRSRSTTASNAATDIPCPQIGLKL
jgi:hypothetical protein